MNIKSSSISKFISTSTISTFLHKVNILHKINIKIKSRNIRRRRSCNYRKRIYIKKSLKIESDPIFKQNEKRYFEHERGSKILQNFITRQLILPESHNEYVSDYFI